jgi:hypothetical protein
MALLRQAGSQAHCMALRPTNVERINHEQEPHRTMQSYIFL